ncbi:unnamed protein product [Amoebophrya sp. A25]|nr:unnamed protein product [Amoebophrya sp. A25]|eukprot:GSA25T00016937001.1
MVKKATGSVKRAPGSSKKLKVTKQGETQLPKGTVVIEGTGDRGDIPDDGAFADPTKAVLRPRNEGESIKIKETVLARRDRNLKAKAANAAKIQEERKKKVQKRLADKLVTPARLLKDSEVRRKDHLRLKRVHRAKKQKVNEANGKILLVVRNKRKNPTPAVLKILKRLQLENHNTVTFVPYDEATCLELKVIEPFVYWGYPSMKIVNELLHKKATFRTSANEKVTLSNNALVEEHLGDIGVLCVEDIVQTIYRRPSDADFQTVMARLWPIDLGDYTKKIAEGFEPEFKKLHFGNVSRKVNKIIEEVL